METKFEIKDFLDMLYRDCNIPAYLYEQNTLVLHMPEQTSLTYPPRKYLDILFSSEERLSYCTTEYGFYYGCLLLDCLPDSRLVFGPVGNIPFSDKDLRNMYKDYVVPLKMHNDMQKFVGTIPQLSLGAFLTKLAFINYCLHHEMISNHDYFPFVTSELSSATSTAEKIFVAKENRFQNRSYELENLTMNLIRNGDPEGFKKLKINDANYHPGITGSTALKQIKNSIIISTTLYTRAAIDGGLDYDTAYQLSDEFIKYAETVHDTGSLYELLPKIGYTFAQKVREVKTPTTSDDLLQKAIRFITQNINQPITVDDVARHVNLSKSYFSAYFKNTLGFSVGAFIRRCKLEEGRHLLLYTNKSLAVISSYLCFSSQSHFQTAFKKQFGMTPMQYRKKPD